MGDVRKRAHDHRGDGTGGSRDGEQGSSYCGPGPAAACREHPCDDDDPDEEQEEGAHVEHAGGRQEVALRCLPDRLARVVGVGGVDAGLDEGRDDAEGGGCRAGAEQHAAGPCLLLSHVMTFRS